MGTLKADIGLLVSMPNGGPKSVLFSVGNHIPVRIEVGQWYGDIDGLGGFRVSSDLKINEPVERVWKRDKVAG